MANIGYLNKAENGGYVGKIDTLAFSNVIGLRRVFSQNPNAPAFEVMALTSAKSWVKIGAVFEKTSSSTGVSFYQGSIDDPSMDRPMAIALFSNEADGFNVAWTRRRARQEMPGGNEQEAPPMEDDAGAGSTDGLGESTAEDAPKGRKGKGAAAAEQPPVDDNVPF